MFSVIFFIHIYLAEVTKCANSDHIPASVTFSQTADEVLDHILTLAEEGDINLAPVEETKQFSLDNKQKYELTLGLQGGILQGLKSVYRVGRSCYFFRQDVMEVGLSGTITFSDLVAQYKVSVTGTPNDPGTKKIVHGNAQLAEISFDFDARCKSSTNCNAELDMHNTIEMVIDIKAKDFQFEDITMGLEYNDASQEDRSIRQMLRSMIRTNLKNFLVNNVALFEQEIEKALDKNDKDFFSL